jgi:hypothetical protein
VAIVLTRDIEVESVPLAFGTDVEGVLDAGTLESLVHTGWAVKVEGVVEETESKEEGEESILPDRLKNIKKGKK